VRVRGFLAKTIMGTESPNQPVTCGVYGKRSITERSQRCEKKNLDNRIRELLETIKRAAAA